MVVQIGGLRAVEVSDVMLKDGYKDVIMIGLVLVVDIARGDGGVGRVFWV